MTKIFDALEKAYKSSHKGLSPSVDDNQRGQKVDSQNVVPLAVLKNVKIDHGILDLNLVAHSAPQSLAADSIKVLRTNLLFPPNGKRPKCILVTSAMPGDGKSFLCANLAISIAQGVEDHVLLIDCDIRKSSIDKLFNIQVNQGLSEYLAKGSDIANYLHKTSINKLTLLPAGKLTSSPTELLTTQKMKNLLTEVSERYKDRFIIIDSAPPFLASETQAISKYVDGVIIVIRARKTPREEITRLIEQLGKEKILGIVFNYADPQIKKYYGYGKAY